MRLCYGRFVNLSRSLSGAELFCFGWSRACAAAAQGRVTAFSVVIIS
jgi:hypothetical protein